MGNGMSDILPTAYPRKKNHVYKDSYMYFVFFFLQEFGYTHLSAGDLLRAERNKQSEYGTLIDTHIKEGKIVPVKITCGLLEQVG